MLITQASWNIKGLNDSIKQEETGKDCIRYKIDLLAVQKMKISNESEKDLESGYKFISLQQKHGSHGDLG